MKFTKWLMLSLLIMLILSQLGVAQTKSLPIDIPGTDIIFFNLRYESDGPPYQQAEQIWQNLNAVFLKWVDSSQNPENLTTEDVKVKQTAESNWVIYLKDTAIVEVDSYHAKINHSTTEQLANKWADNLRAGVEEFVQRNLPLR